MKKLFNSGSDTIFSYFGSDSIFSYVGSGSFFPLLSAPAPFFFFLLSALASVLLCLFSKWITIIHDILWYLLWFKNYVYFSFNESLYNHNSGVIHDYRYPYLSLTSRVEWRFTDEGLPILRHWKSASNLILKAQNQFFMRPRRFMQVFIFKTS